MRIIIAGAGDVGFHLAKLLAIESHDLNIIDMDEERLKYISNHLDVHTTKGNATSYKILNQAQVNDIDLLIAVTESESANLAICVIGKKMGAKKTIARVSNSEFLSRRDILDVTELGIDEVICPESLAAKEIKRLLKESALTDHFDFENGMLSLVGIAIDENSELKDRTLQETAYLNPDYNFITVAILRNSKTIIPNGSSRFLEGDHAYFICLPDGVGRVMDLSNKQRESIKNVMILGGSKIGVQAVTQLSKKYNIKLIEKNKDKSFDLCDRFPNAMIINGDGRDVELLKEEGIHDMDAFIAVTGDSETNMISSLVAKNNNVPKTISLVENIDYIHLSQNIGVDTMINKKLIAASFIFRYIRRGEVLNLTSIHGVDAEILEFEVKQGSKILENEIRFLSFPRNAIIGGVIREGKGMIARGNFTFQPLDKVVVLSSSVCIRTVEEFFK